VHENNINHVPQNQRAIKTKGVDVWATDQQSNDQKLLAKLNQYCFRCHGAISFSVFDKRRVKALKQRIIFNLSQKPGTKNHMPQGRSLTEDELKELQSLIDDTL